jgi:hypothetical protein
MKCQNNFQNRTLFSTYSCRFLRFSKLEQLEFKLEKILGLINIQEKLEKYNTKIYNFYQNTSFNHFILKKNLSLIIFPKYRIKKGLIIFGQNLEIPVIVYPSENQTRRDFNSFLLFS